MKTMPRNPIQLHKAEIAKNAALDAMNRNKCADTVAAFKTASAIVRQFRRDTVRK